MDKEGFLYFLRRKEECIRFRGFLISTTEVEKAVGSHPKVTLNRMMRRSPSQNCGTDSPTRLRDTMDRSRRLPGRRAAVIPRETPATNASPNPEKTRRNVAGELLEHDLHGGSALPERVAEVEARRAQHVVDELHDDGAVQPQLCLQRRPVLGGGLQGQHHLDRITDETGHHEHDDGHAEDHDDGLADAGQQVASHGTFSRLIGAPFLRRSFGGGGGTPAKAYGHGLTDMSLTRTNPSARGANTSRSLAP
jgi:hypothetical protein